MKVQIKKLISSVLALAMTASLFTTSLVSAAPILPMSTITDYKIAGFSYNTCNEVFTYKEVNFTGKAIYAPGWIHDNAGNNVVINLSEIAENSSLIDTATLKVTLDLRSPEAGAVQEFKVISAALPTYEDGSYIAYEDMQKEVDGTKINNIIKAGQVFDPEAPDQKRFELTYGNTTLPTITFDVKDWVLTQLEDDDATNDVMAFALCNVGYDAEGNKGYLSKHASSTAKCTCAYCADPNTTFYAAHINAGVNSISLEVTYIDDSVVKAQELVDLKADIAAGNQTAVDSKLAEIWGSDDYYYKKYQDLNNKEAVHSAILATEEFWQLKKSVKTAVITAYDAENVLALNKKVYSGLQNVGKNSEYVVTGINCTGGTSFASQGKDIVTGEWNAVRGLKFAYNLTSLQDTKEFIKYVGFTPAQGINEYKTGGNNYCEPITAGMAEGGAVVPAPISAEKFSDITDRAQLVNATSEPLATDPSAIPTQHIWDRNITAEQNDQTNGEIITFDTVDITEDFTSKVDDGIASYIFWLVNRDRKSTGYYNGAIHSSVTVEYVSAPELFETGTTEKKVKYLSLFDADLATTYASLADTMKAVVDEHIINSTATDMQTLVGDVKALISSDSVALPLIKEAISSEDTEEIKSYIQLIMGGKSYEFARYEGCADAVNAALAEVNNDDLTTEIFAATVKAAVADAMAARKTVLEDYVYYSNMRPNIDINGTSDNAFHTAIKVEPFLTSNLVQKQNNPQMHTGQYTVSSGQKVYLDLSRIEGTEEFIKYASFVPMINAWGFCSQTKDDVYLRPDEVVAGEAITAVVVPAKVPAGYTYEELKADYKLAYDDRAHLAVVGDDALRTDAAAIPTQYVVNAEEAAKVNNYESSVEQGGRQTVDMDMDVVDITADLKARIANGDDMASYNFWLNPGKEVPAGVTSVSSLPEYWSKILTNNDEYKVYIEYVTEDEFIANVKTSDNTKAYVEFVLTDVNANVWENQVTAEAEAQILEAARNHDCATYAEFRTMVNNLVKAQRDTDLVLSDITTKDNGYSVSITNQTDDVKPMFVVAAAYGENNKMLASVIYTEAGNIVEKIDVRGNAGFTFAFDGVEGVKEIKVFCWADAATIKPYCDAKTYTVTQ